MISPLADSRCLEAFLAVCREGTVGRAALRIHKTQPAITYNIQRLEESLGARLFERSGRRLILTAEGRRLRALGEQYEAAFARFRQQAGRPPAEPESIRIATVSGFGRYVLYPRLRDAAGEPAGQMVLLFRTAAEVFRMVEDGDVDCGTVYHPKITNRLQIEPVYNEELVLIAPAGMRRPRASWQELRGYAHLPFVTYEEGDYVFGRWFEAQFGKQPTGGMSRWHVTELEEVIDAVKHGGGVSIVPLDAVAGVPGVRVVRPGERRCFNQVFRVQRTGGTLPDLLERVFQSMSGRQPAASARRFLRPGLQPFA